MQQKQEKEKRSSATRCYQDPGPKLPKRRQGARLQGFVLTTCKIKLALSHKRAEGGRRPALRRGRGARGGGVARSCAARPAGGAVAKRPDACPRPACAPEPIPGTQSVWPAWPDRGPRCDDIVAARASEPSLVPRPTLWEKGSDSKINSPGLLGKPSFAAGPVFRFFSWIAECRFLKSREPFLWVYDSLHPPFLDKGLFVRKPL